MTDVPLEVKVKITLDKAYNITPGEILHISPNAQDNQFRDFLLGDNFKKRILFAVGAEKVLYDKKTKYSKVSDRTVIDEEAHVPVRELIYQLEE